MLNLHDLRVELLQSGAKDLLFFAPSEESDPLVVQRHRGTEKSETGSQTFAFALEVRC
jgi:hypothetical protein